MEMKYVCPMHPEVVRSEPGNCPECGMSLVAKSAKNVTHDQDHGHAKSHMHEHGAGTPAGPIIQGGKDEHMHDKHAGHHTENFLKRFWICLALTLPVLLLSHMVQQWLGIHIEFLGSQYILLALSGIIYFYGGMPFLRGMVNEIRHNAIGMMTLVALAISVAFVYSVAVVLGLPGMDFFWELATLIDIMLLGHWLEMRSQMAASRALESMVKLLPSIAHVEINGKVTDVPLQEVRHHDIMHVRPGEKIAADGIILEGHSSINESMLTGESKPVHKQTGNEVIGGSVNEDGILKIRVTGTGPDSYLTKVIRLVESAQASKSKTQNLADKVAKWLTYASIAVGIATFIYWSASGSEVAFSLERLVTVMVTSCPHALGVAIPLVASISATSAAINGLLIRNRTSFENARLLTALVFDKTGTLTTGAHAVQDVISVDDRYSSDDIAQYAGGVEQNSEHFIARGLIKYLDEHHLEMWPSEEFNYSSGIGVSGIVRGKKVVAAGPNYFSRHQLPLPTIPGHIDQETMTVNFVLIDEKVAGMITYADTLRESSAKAISELKKMGITSYLLTGDNEKIAAGVASKLKIDHYRSNVLPEQKLHFIKSLQDAGEFVGMTGDGVNDAPALAQADVGIAIGSGTDVASETADIILVNSDPMDVVKAISFGRATYRKMVQNLYWATGYNIIAIPLAAGILYPYFVLSPAVGAVLMSLSTIIVALNAQLLRKNLR